MKKAFVTGSSRGIGRAAALRLARDGYELILHCSGNTANALSVKEIIEQKGGRANIVSADLRDIAQLQGILPEIRDADVLVLNASVQYRCPWEKISYQDCMEQITCNFASSLLLIQAVVSHMRGNGWGRIITIGSVQEAKPHPDMLVYSASKAAQTNMVKSLSMQLAKDGITVNNVAPGVIDTDRNREALSDPVYAKKVMQSIPAGFLGEPEDCAGIISLLCSDSGRYITGQSIYVDGGKGI